MPDTYELKDVELFAEGTWNGDAYSSRDLEDMVAAHEALKGKVTPKLKLGHDEDQRLIQADGYPALGWIDNLRVEGKKLLGDISKIPRMAYELIRQGAYPGISSEIWWNFTDGDDGKVYPRVLTGAAILGDDMPAVTSLSDIAAMYRAERKALHHFSIDGGDFKEYEAPTTEYDHLPDSSFLTIDSGGSLDDDGRTIPRTLRRFPVRDADGTIDAGLIEHSKGLIAKLSDEAERKRFYALIESEIERSNQMDEKLKQLEQEKAELERKLEAAKAEGEKATEYSAELDRLKAENQKKEAELQKQYALERKTRTDAFIAKYTGDEMAIPPALKGHVEHLHSVLSESNGDVRKYSANGTELDGVSVLEAVIEGYAKFSPIFKQYSRDTDESMPDEKTHGDKKIEEYQREYSLNYEQALQKFRSEDPEGFKTFWNAHAEVNV